MNGVGAPWLLYGIGAVLALVLTYFKVPALYFRYGFLFRKTENWKESQASTDNKI